MKKIMSLLGLLMMVGSAIAMEQPKGPKQKQDLTLTLGRAVSFLDYDGSLFAGGDNGVMAIFSKDSALPSWKYDSKVQAVIKGVANLDLGKQIHNSVVFASSSDHIPKIVTFPKSEVIPVQEPQGRALDFINAFLSLNNNEAITGDKAGNIVLVNKKENKINVRTFKLPSAPIVSLAKINEKEFLAATKNALYRLDAPSGQILNTEFFTDKEIERVTAVEPKQWAVGFADGSIVILDSSKGGPTQRFELLAANGKPVLGLKGLNKQYLISLTQQASSKTVTIWDAVNHKELFSFSGKNAFVLAAQYVRSTKSIQIALGFALGKIATYEIPETDLSYSAIPAAARQPVIPSEPTTSTTEVEEEEALEAR